MTKHEQNTNISTPPPLRYCLYARKSSVNAAAYYAQAKSIIRNAESKMRNAGHGFRLPTVALAKVGVSPSAFIESLTATESFVQ